MPSDNNDEDDDDDDDDNNNSNNNNNVAPLHYNTYFHTLIINFGAWVSVVFKALRY
jgi:hypothetical protein